MFVDSNETLILAMQTSNVADTPDYKFGKKHKLYGDKPIGELFELGRSFSRYPLRVTYLLAKRTDGELPLRMMVSVGKKRFKRAVKRNRVKRLVREAFRLNCHDLRQAVRNLDADVSLHVAFVFVGKDLPLMPDVLQSVSASINKLTKIVNDGISQQVSPDCQ